MNFGLRRYAYPTVALIVLAAALSAENGKTIGPRAGEEINWQVTGGGGILGISTNYSLTGTAGQTATGPGASAALKMHHGYWQDFGSGSCCTIAGDANDDGKVNVGDAVYIITYVFRGGPAPPCEPAADANADGKINVGDAVYIITYVFRGGPAPTCP